MHIVRAGVAQGVVDRFLGDTEDAEGCARGKSGNVEAAVEMNLGTGGSGQFEAAASEGCLDAGVLYSRRMEFPRQLANRLTKAVCFLL